MSKQSSDDSIQITKPLLYLIGLAAVITLVGFTLQTISTNRQQVLYDKYATEAAPYIAANRNGLINIFKLMSNSCSSSYSCPSIEQAMIMKEISPNIKDFSSTMFVKKGTSGTIITMTLSGYQTSENIDEDKEKVLLELLDGKKDAIPLDSYTSSGNYGKKQAVLPVKDDNGHVVGGLVRYIIDQ